MSKSKTTELYHKKSRNLYLLMSQLKTDGIDVIDIDFKGMNILISKPSDAFIKELSDLSINKSLITAKLKGATVSWENARAFA